MYVLTESDRQKIKELIDRTVNTKLNSIKSTFGSIEVLSEIYVGKTESTIPALIDGTPPEAGSGDVDIYKINLDGELILIEEDKTCYNIGSEISEGFFLVLKLKSGHWLAYPGGGGSGGGFHFVKMEEPLVANGTAYAKILDEDMVATTTSILVKGSLIPDFYTIPVDAYAKAELKDGSYYITGAYYL